MRFVEAAGGQTGGVRGVLTADKGYGLVASRAARRGDVLLSVPASLALSAEAALRSDLGGAIAEFDPELADYSFIALMLMHE
eukprot:5237002-Prymnesium_polylepis.1